MSRKSGPARQRSQARKIVLGCISFEIQNKNRANSRRPNDGGSNIYAAHTCRRQTQGRRNRNASQSRLVCLGCRAHLSNPRMQRRRLAPRFNHGSRSPRRMVPGQSARGPGRHPSGRASSAGHGRDSSPDRQEAPCLNLNGRNKPAPTCWRLLITSRTTTRMPPSSGLR